MTDRPYELDRTRGGRVSLRDMLVDAEKRLITAGVASPGHDASAIAAYVLGTTRTRMLLHDELTGEQRVRFESLLTRRLARVPLQHLLGTAAFRRLEVRVGPGVFVPRPETELVVEAGVRVLADRPDGERIGIDLCTGSGVVALAMATEVAGSEVHAVELDDTAADWAAGNIADHAETLARVGSTVTLHRTDATTCVETGQPLAGLIGRAAVVVTNPPYIPDHAIPRDPEVRLHDPAVALYGGPDGLEIVRGISRQAALLLRPGGLLVVEHGDDQGMEAGLAGVPGLLAAQLVDAGIALEQHTPQGKRIWRTVEDRPDLSQRPRFTVAIRA